MAQQLPATRMNQGGQGGQMARRREHPLARLARDFDALFGGSLASFDRDFGDVRVWDFDVSENDREITVRAEMPGFEEKEIDVQINQDVLTIKAEKEQKGDGQEEYRAFFRSVTLPPGIDPEKVKASYHNGVLELHIPRAAGSQPKRIAIQGDQGATEQTGRQGESKGNGSAAPPAGEQAGAASAKAQQ